MKALGILCIGLIAVAIGYINLFAGIVAMAIGCVIVNSLSSK